MRSGCVTKAKRCATGRSASCNIPNGYTRSMRSGANFALRNEPKKRHPDFLDSWEEIANFTGRSVRTVRRWAELYDFPVHQDRLGIRGYASEIDAWMAQPLSFRRPPDFQANRRWNEDLRKDSNDL